MESNDELKEIDIINSTCYCFDDIMRVGDFDFDNILLGEKSYENSYKNMTFYDFMTFHTKRLWVENHCVLGSIKKMDLPKFMMQLDI